MIDLYSMWCAPKGPAYKAADLVDDVIIEHHDVSMDEIMVIRRDLLAKHPNCQFTIQQTYQGKPHSNVKHAKNSFRSSDFPSFGPAVKPRTRNAAKPIKGDASARVTPAPQGYADVINQMVQE